MMIMMFAGPSLYEMAALTNELDTLAITTKVKEILMAHNVGQKVNIIIIITIINIVITIIIIVNIIITMARFKGCLINLVNHDLDQKKRLSTFLPRDLSFNVVLSNFLFSTQQPFPVSCSDLHSKLLIHISL